MNNTLILFLLFFFIIGFPNTNIYAQSSPKVIKDIHLEMNAFMAELQLKNHLFKSSQFAEKANAGFGGELIVGASFKNNWGIKIGASYFIQDFKNSLPFNLIYSNPNNEEISSADYYFENLNNSFTNYDISLRMSFNGSNCNNPGTPILDGELIEMSFSRSNVIEQIGIPFILEKSIGKARNKLYLSLGLVPTILIHDPKKLKYRNNGVRVRDSRSGCSSPDGGYIRQIEITQLDLIFKNQNIIDNRLDVIFELGLLHELKKNIFKITLFLEESISGHSKVNGKTYQSQMAGIKFGMRKKVYKGN